MPHGRTAGRSAVERTRQHQPSPCSHLKVGLQQWVHLHGTAGSRGVTASPGAGNPMRSSKSPVSGQFGPAACKHKPVKQEPANNSGVATTSVRTSHCMGCQVIP
ncbi:hypothetical protein HaLaN_22057 [Haematococcus lacustris]|uniref:Uncharacterized protein n=1 Tax=Haematococcus lacustris TaxID=44745 RepID=A0A699ZSZ5_HAELA|nr:hypothetical protein HaLaN_22057 [Haematococcus lacustris]